MSKKTAVKKSQKQPARKKSPAVAKNKSVAKVKAAAKAAPRAKTKAPAKALAKVATKAKPAAAKAKPKAKTPATRKAKLTIESYVAGLKGWQATIVNNLRKLLKVSAPGTREGIRDDQPAFEVNGPFAFIKADEQSVNFGFWRGDELDDPHKLLKKASGKIRVVALSSKATLPEDPLVAMIQKAVVLNLAKGDPTAEL